MWYPILKFQALERYFYSLTQNFKDINKMSFSKPTYNGMQQIFSFYLNNYMELFKTISRIFRIFLSILTITEI